jgi:hypothetical protein
MDKAHQGAPVIAMLHRGEGTLPFQTPDRAQDGLQANAVFVDSRDLDDAVWKCRGDFAQQGAQTLLELRLRLRVRVDMAWTWRGHGVDAAPVDERLAVAGRPSPVADGSVVLGARLSRRRRCAHTSGRAAAPVRSTPHVIPRGAPRLAAVGVAGPGAAGL